MTFILFMLISLLNRRQVLSTVRVIWVILKVFMYNDLLLWKQGEISRFPLEILHCVLFSVTVCAINQHSNLTFLTYTIALIFFDSFYDVSHLLFCRLCHSLVSVKLLTKLLSNYSLTHLVTSRSSKYWQASLIHPCWTILLL